MSEYWHPTGSGYKSGYSAIMDKRGRLSGIADAPMYFAVIECQQQGAFPTRVKDGPLDFNRPDGEFFVTSHELKAAVKAGRVQYVKVNRYWAPLEVIQFKDYVRTYRAEKVTAKKAGDKVAEIFAKLLLNSAYGKFGSNPDNYFDWFLQGEDEPNPDEPYEIYSTHEGGINVWRKPTAAKRFFDVATAASVTGAARAVLLEALSTSERPIYCDTDSIICRRFAGPMDSAKLGSWKHEASGDTIAIAGKKLYALRAGDDYVKTASKGVRLKGDQIFELARGGTIHWENNAPTFSIGGAGRDEKGALLSARFVHRKIQSR
jgi:hypothetical protein